MLKIAVVMVLALAAGRGLCLLNGGVRSLLRAGSSLGWPKVQGLVVPTDDVRQDQVYSTRAMARYQAGDGKMYSTDLVSFGDTLNPFDRAQAGLLRVRYPDGAKVSVSYEPGDPRIAVPPAGAVRGHILAIGREPCISPSGGPLPDATAGCLPEPGRPQALLRLTASRTT
jgi:hypothetical protein